MGDLAVLRALSVDTFTAAFGHLNTPENMAEYCARSFGEDALRDQMKNPDTLFWFVEKDGVVAGYMKLNTGSAQTDFRGVNALELERIYVAAGFLGQGLGGYMLGQAAQLAREAGKACLWLGVWEHNTRAICFYEAHGFREAGTHAFLLGSDAQTDIIMRLDLPRAD
jgi:ribosomal protein S18 acetylase RimI-like enzyme